MAAMFASMSSPQLREAAQSGAIVILPVGTVEEHGSHLPVGTDAVIAEEVARRVADETGVYIAVTDVAVFAKEFARHA